MAQNKNRRATGVVALLAGALLLSACGSGGDAGPTPAAATGSAGQAASGQSAGDHNASDVMYLQMAIEHHRQGQDLVELAETRATRDEIKTLASAIQVTQKSEVDSMVSWLKEWGEPESSGTDPQVHADHGGDHSTSPELIAEVAGKSGAEFETAFLNLLIAHQHNAVDLTKVVRENGVNQQTKELAERVFQSRTAQITQMLKYLS
ncbi:MULTISPECIES: DUF305 domain-containing protein [Actinosynnema]|uniref:DUF305 domain-containing protein n=1 Tax=Actinosynnema TaxID=40566 RepID=UPI0020A2ED2B|nr:DUF305 domain-containing protein [Actinosynnema pretiosum]MCP2098305.1 Uncharacterized conserved protein, DUF305 family [Actinosynnema pretiosum]